MDTTIRTRVSPFRFQSFLGEPDPEEEMIRAREMARQAAIKAVEAPPPPPTFSESELAAAKQNGYDQGLEAGYQRAMAEVKAQQVIENQTLQQLMAKIRESADEALHQKHVFFEELQAILPKLALSIAKKIAGEALQNNPLLEIEAVIAHCLSELAEDKQLTVVVNPAVAPYLEGILAEQYFESTGHSLSLKVTSDPTIAIEDCRVEWPSGCVERNSAQLWADMEKTLASFAVLFEPAAPRPTSE